MSRRRCLFVGPSLTGTGFKADESSFTLFGPAKLGSVFRATEAGYGCIGIADGYFGNVAPVWHKEILWALSRGVVVMGGASMGALRAAELSAYGMVGVGSAYQHFMSGALTDDDEVCLIHAPREFGYRPLSIPMLNFRVTLGRMMRKGMLDAEGGRTLISAMKHLHFSERTKESFVGAAVGLLGAREAAELSDNFTGEYVDVKRDDCIALIEAMRSRGDEIQARASGWQFPATRNWTLQFGARVAELPGLDPY